MYLYIAEIEIPLGMEISTEENELGTYRLTV